MGLSTSFKSLHPHLEENGLNVDFTAFDLFFCRLSLYSRGKVHLNTYHLKLILLSVMDGEFYCGEFAIAVYL